MPLVPNKATRAVDSTAFNKLELTGPIDEEGNGEVRRFSLDNFSHQCSARPANRNALASSLNIELRAMGSKCPSAVSWGVGGGTKSPS